MLLDAKNRELCPTAELLLMFASRAQNVDQLILPALSAGRTVLSDRFTDSTLVYQGVGRGLGADVVYELDRIACRGLIPDLTLLIDIDAETGLARARRRSVRTGDSETRMEEQDVGFHRRVREAYRQLAADESRRVRLIDGSQTREAVAEQVWGFSDNARITGAIAPPQDPRTRALRFSALTLVPSTLSHRTGTSTTLNPWMRAISRSSTSKPNPSSRWRGKMTRAASLRNSLNPHWVSRNGSPVAARMTTLNTRPLHSRSAA